MAIPEIVMTLLAPTVLSANVPLMPVRDMETVSPLTIPTSAAESVTS